MDVDFDPGPSGSEVDIQVVIECLIGVCPADAPAAMSDIRMPGHISARDPGLCSMGLCLIGGSLIGGSARGSCVALSFQAGQ